MNKFMNCYKSHCVYRDLAVDKLETLVIAYWAKESYWKSELAG